MDRKKQRRVYVTLRQKKKLIEFVTKHPELISSKFGEGFTHKDSATLWQTVSAECNALGGARKNWKQWRKTWQDLRSKTRRRNGDTHRDLNTYTLTPAEQEVLGIKDALARTESPREKPVFIQLEEEILQEHNYSDVVEPIQYTDSISEPASPPEIKVFPLEHTDTLQDSTKRKNSKHSECYFNCDILSKMEEKKLHVKEDYLNFKKQYLKQKLKLIREQTEALKTIAQELSGDK